MIEQINFLELESPSNARLADAIPKAKRPLLSRYKRIQDKFNHDPRDEHKVFVDTSSTFTNKTVFNFVDLFAGAGGMTLGFVQAGFRPLLSVEVDKDASATYRRNFPDSIHCQQRVEDLTDVFINQVTKNHHVHVVCGGPPCQGFSIAGRRNPNDERNKLFREFVRLVKTIQPDYVVMENVPGILTMQNGAFFDYITSAFAEAGYPQMSVAILEAAAYGVPQIRPRSIFIANRHNLSNPYPLSILDESNYVPIEARIDDLKDQPADPASNHEWTRHSASMEGRLAQVAAGHSLYPSYTDAWKRQYMGVPAMTIKENHGGTHIHPQLNRVLSAREMARLQSFPDNFVFAGTMKRAMWQIGNAVPPLLARHIALAVRQFLG